MLPGTMVAKPRRGPCRSPQRLTVDLPLVPVIRAHGLPGERRANLAAKTSTSPNHSMPAPGARREGAARATHMPGLRNDRVHVSRSASSKAQGRRAGRAALRGASQGRGAARVRRPRARAALREQRRLESPDRPGREENVFPLPFHIRHSRALSLEYCRKPLNHKRTTETTEKRRKSLGTKIRRTRRNENVGPNKVARNVCSEPKP